jgi:hypothetical protein
MERLTTGRLHAYPFAIPLPAVATIVVGLVSAGIGLLRGSAVRAATGWRHGALWAVVGVAGGVLLRTRVGLAGLIGGAMLSGIAFAEIERRLGTIGRSAAIRRGLPAALGAALVAAMIMSTPRWIHVPSPLPATAEDDLIAMLQTGSGPILELPVTGKSRDTLRHATAMYRSIFHRRPLLNGYASYFPAGFRGRMALAKRLPDPAALMTLRQTTGLTTIVVHRMGMPASQRAAWDMAARRPRPDLHLVWQGRGARVFQVGPIPAPSR